MTGVLIFILVILGLWLLGPLIRRWATQWMVRRMQRTLFRAAGIPDPKQQAKERKKQQRREGRSGRKNSSDNTRRTRSASHSDGPIIPRNYAEDVEFTEYKEFTSDVQIDEVNTPKGKATEIQIEEQVSDVQFVEIKDADKNG